MTYAVGNPLEAIGVQIFGSLWAFAIFVIIVLFIIMFLAGFDPMMALLFIVPVIYAFGKGAWIPSWIAYFTFVVLVAWAGYMFYNRFIREY